MPWLVVNEEGREPRALEIAGGPFRIGRRAGNDLVLSDFGASRDHSRIEREGSGWRLVDLGTANGTYLNGRRLPANSPQPLEPGDEIQIGRVKFHYFERRPGTAVIDPTAAEAGDATRTMPADGLAGFARSPDVVKALDQVALPKKVEYFTVLHDLAKLLLGARAFQEIAHTALDLLFRVIPVERAAIALSTAADQPLATLVEHTRKGGEHVTISQTIASWVLRERIAVITADARHDPRVQRGGGPLPAGAGVVRPVGGVGLRRAFRRRRPAGGDPLGAGSLQAGDGGAGRGVAPPDPPRAHPGRGTPDGAGPEPPARAHGRDHRGRGRRR